MTTTERAPAGVDAGAWRLNVLGPVELCYDGRPVEVAGTTRTLLALLARSPGEEVATDTIVAGIWGSEPPEDCEKEVASHVSRLRKALTVVAPECSPTTIVVTLARGYILAIEPSNADILAFERLVADGRRALEVGQPELAIARLDAALALWRGAAYQDFDDHAFVRAEAARLEALRQTAVEARAEARLSVGVIPVPALPEQFAVTVPACVGRDEEVRWLLAALDLAATSDGTSVTPTVLAAGTTMNTVPELASLTIDVRAWTRTELDRVDRAIHGLVPSLPDAALEVEGGVNRYPMMPVVALPLLERARMAARDIGLPAPMGAHAPGASDANITAALGVPTLDGLGAVGGNAHARGEYIEVSMMPERAALLAALIERLLAAPH